MVQNKSRPRQMNKKVLYLFIILNVLMIVGGAIAKSTEKRAPNSTSPSATPIESFEILQRSDGTADMAQGTCQVASDCIPAGCSSHICSNDPSLITTCVVPSVIPSQQGYSCGCINNKCAWYK